MGLSFLVFRTFWRVNFLMGNYLLMKAKKAMKKPRKISLIWMEKLTKRKKIIEKNEYTPR